MQMRKKRKKKKEKKIVTEGIDERNPVLSDWAATWGKAVNGVYGKSNHGMSCTHQMMQASRSSDGSQNRYTSRAGDFHAARVEGYSDESIDGMHPRAKPASHCK
jgi:hypothetical protein